MKEKKEEEEKEGTKNWNIYINNNFGKKLKNIPKSHIKHFPVLFFIISKAYTFKLDTSNENI